MCGRYYINDNMTGELRSFLSMMNGMDSVKMPSAFNGAYCPGDICPSQKAGVIRAERGSLILDEMTWGFPGFDGKGLLINARAETVLTKHTYRECMKSGRCVIPAGGFYEWNSSKEKFSFAGQEGELLFMAGCYNRFEDGARFVILTTEANDCMRPVHGRMPLILEPEEVSAWLTEDVQSEEIGRILRKRPAELKRSTDYEQMKLF